MKKIVIIDYGLGNVYGLQQACSAAGLETVITNNKKQISDAYGIILPGVGAFHVAMKNLKQLEGLAEIIQMKFFHIMMILKIFQKFYKNLGL